MLGFVKTHISRGPKKMLSGFVGFVTGGAWSCQQHLFHPAGWTLPPPTCVYVPSAPPCMWVWEYSANVSVQCLFSHPQEVVIGPVKWRKWPRGLHRESPWDAVRSEEAAGRAGPGVQSEAGEATEGKRGHVPASTSTPFPSSTFLRPA